MTVRIRPATHDDIGPLGRYQLESYGGYADVMYADAVPGLKPRQILDMRLEQEGTSFHYTWGSIAEIDGALAGGVHAYPVDLEDTDPPDPFIPSDRLQYFAPLEGLVLPGSYYLNAIAVEPSFKSQGVGKVLLNHVIATAIEQKFPAVSLLAMAENVAARRLYESHGFVECGRRTTVPHPALKFHGDLLLMALEII